MGKVGKSWNKYGKKWEKVVKSGKKWRLTLLDLGTFSRGLFFQFVKVTRNLVIMIVGPCTIF